MATTAEQKEALEDLDHLAQDIGMLASGDWVPDDDSCAASLESIERVRKFVANLSL
ncbi:TPA: hypothetical protein N2C61_003423 [Pseudomonas aeruginosa]|nr:hypothetical protein [Pseudomonas aeruginosa]EKV3012260.1 hypothetical protein [Pseudomonas aeruginosa]HCL4132316.1 hypothetical protein [Pseudomonas aeruginosa]